MTFRKWLFAAAAVAVAIALTGCPGNDVTPPAPPAPDGVDVTPATATVQRDATRQFTATVRPMRASQSVIWTVTPATTGVSIDQATGMLTVGQNTPAGALTLTVRATAVGHDGVFGEATVNVPAITIAMNPVGPVTVRRNDRRQFRATVNPPSTSQDVNWSVTPETSGVSISDTGLLEIAADAAGGELTLTVRATWDDDNTIFGETTVNVPLHPAPSPSSIEINTDPAGQGAATRGQTLTITVNIQPEEASQAVTWSFSPANAGAIAATDIDGVFGFTVNPALAHGTPVAITARPAGNNVLYDVIALTVNVIPTSITNISPTEGTGLARGGEFDFTATVLPTGAPSDIVWSVPANIGTFADNRLTVLDNAPLGDITVTATAGPATATVTLTVYHAPDSVNITAPLPAVTTVTRHVPLQFSAVVLPSYAAQYIDWIVTPDGAGSFDEAGRFTVSTALAHDSEVTIVARARGTTVDSAPRTFSVNVPVTGISISPAAQSFTTNFAAAFQFAHTLEPAGANPAVTWALANAPAGVTLVNGLLTVPAIPTAANFTVRVTATGTAHYDTATVNVVAPGQGEFTLSFEGFRDMADDVNMDDVNRWFSITDSGVSVSVFNAGDFSNIRWFRGYEEIHVGDTLILDARVHGNEIGYHRVTVVVTVGGASVPRMYSRNVTFRVDL